MAINTASALYKKGKSVVLVDMDYQFGIIAKSLDIASQYGIKDIFEHPDRGVDATLLKRMVVSYKDKFDVIAAPNSLHFMPSVSPDMIRDMLSSLQSRYDYVVLDIPHVWDRWVATALSSSSHIVVVAQLWLKSVVHCSRMLNTWRAQGVEGAAISVVINRSGAKFKEALNPRDFERASGHKIDFFISNDIKTVVRAENNGSSIFELGNSPLANQIQQFVDDIVVKCDRQRSQAQGAINSSVESRG
jgi:pilus assembly protein CpaE